MYAAVCGDMSEAFGSYPHWNKSSGITEHHGVKFEDGNEFCQVR